MRTFEHFPEDSTCIICGQSHDAECVLIAIAGTGDGSIIEAMPVHAECLDPALMMYDKNVGIIYISDYHRRMMDNDKQLKN